MLAYLLRSTIGRTRMAHLRRAAQAYERPSTRTVIEEQQVRKFNTVWRYCLDEVPFYDHWRRDHGLPARIESLSDLRRFPVLTKADVVGNSDEIFQHGRISSAYSTGGSTGTPTRYPRGAQDAASIYANIYVGRGWWGIRPFDSYVHVWGHSHLFGGSKSQKLKRAVLDRLANATRINAYDMSESALKSHAATIIAKNPAYVVGYTSAVFKIARYIETHGIDVSKLTKMRAVVVTAETVSAADVDLISRVFGVPVAIEYGAAETGVMAYSRGGSWPLQVLWRSFIVHAESRGDLVITTLDDRLFPLINYSIGDTSAGGDVVGGNAVTLDAVTGRSQDVVNLRTLAGTFLELSPILPVHILKGMPGIVAVQYRQEKHDLLRILISADHPLALDVVAKAFFAHLRRDHPDVDDRSVAFEQVSSPLLTKAGKQALFV